MTVVGTPPHNIYFGQTLPSPSQHTSATGVHFGTTHSLTGPAQDMFSPRFQGIYRFTKDGANSPADFDELQVQIKASDFTVKKAIWGDEEFFVEVPDDEDDDFQDFFVNYVSSYDGNATFPPTSP